MLPPYVSAVVSLPPFAMWLAFPTSDYYGGSATLVPHRWATHLHTSASRVYARELFKAP